jgi:Fe-S cluster assembly protein SufD
LEAWKYTPLTALTTHAFELDAPRVALTATDGAAVRSLAEVLRTEPELVEAHLRRESRNGMVALNNAFLDDGAVVIVPAGAELRTPIEITYAAPTAGRMAHPRTLIVLGANARATVVERFAGATGASLTNAVCEIVLEDGATLDHYRVQQSGDDAFHIADVSARVGRDATLSSLTLSFGGKLARCEASVVLAQGATVHLRGLVLAHAEQNHDSTSFISHDAPHGTSRELFKCVVTDHATSTFAGHIVVQPGAQKTDAAQSNRNLLLSPNATANSKPHLEIYADDVKCAHGATSGQLEENGLFYLRSRGISADEARALLAYAFVSEVVELIAPPALREEAETYARGWLRGAP